MTLKNEQIHSSNRTRNYNPGAGRFMSEDPILFNKAEYNTYRYTYNNPVVYSDPSGEGPLSALVCSAASVASTFTVTRDIEKARETINNRIDKTIHAYTKEIEKYRYNATQSEKYQCPPEDRKEKIEKLELVIKRLKKMKIDSNKKLQQIEDKHFKSSSHFLGICTLSGLL
ncbi:RHS repeat domain-containing protein [Bacteriovorax sp. BAL6_X]|uniref:RHS repeat domain-containing protein n=1 Tax=Bacteriovorax sp. BAL6_X TaxID=1201290 RepID=UPI00210157D5|nr:RHS repeat-associated core domain-containing protein [Bacteriovorax sp. BAL6_X]